MKSVSSPVPMPAVSTKRRTSWVRSVKPGPGVALVSRRLFCFMRCSPGSPMFAHQHIKCAGAAMLDMRLAQARDQALKIGLPEPERELGAQHAAFARDHQ